MYLYLCFTIEGWVTAFHMSWAKNYTSYERITSVQLNFKVGSTPIGRTLTESKFLGMKIVGACFYVCILWPQYKYNGSWLKPEARSAPPLSVKREPMNSLPDEFLLLGHPG